MKLGQLYTIAATEPKSAFAITGAAASASAALNFDAAAFAAPAPATPAEAAYLVSLQPHHMARRLL